jgi:hypothetical protein
MVIDVLRLRPNQPSNLLLPNLSSLSKQRPTKHTTGNVVHHSRAHSSRPRPNKIRADAAPRANEFHRDPRCALLLRRLRNEWRDGFPVDVMPTSLALRLKHELVRAASSLFRTLILPLSLSSDHYGTCLSRYRVQRRHLPKERGSARVCLGGRAPLALFWRLRVAGRSIIILIVIATVAAQIVKYTRE